MAKHRHSTNRHEEGTIRTESTGFSSSMSTGLSEATMIWTSSDESSSQSSMRVRHTAEDLERQIRALARRFTVAEFIAIRGKVEDIFDTVLLAGRI